MKVLSLVYLHQNSPENSLPSSSKRKNTENISLTYDVNDHVYSEAKFVQLHTDLINHEVRRILIWS